MFEGGSKPEPPVDFDPYGVFDEARIRRLFKRYKPEDFMKP
jgi:hypothetical protein